MLNLLDLDLSFLFKNKSMGSQNNAIEILDDTLKYGFVGTPRIVLLDPTLDMASKTVYAVLLNYAWQTGSCFPGQARMAKDLGVHPNTIGKYLNILKKKGLITWKQRGFNRTNKYFILPLSKVYPQKTLESQVRVSPEPQAHVDQESHKRVNIIETDKYKKKEYKQTLTSDINFQDFSLEAQELANTFGDQSNIKFYQSIVNKRDKEIIHKDDLFTAIDITRRIIRTKQIDGKPPIKKQGALFNSKLKELVTKRKHKNNLTKLNKEISKLVNSKSISDKNKPNANTRRNFLLNQAQEMDKKEFQISRNTS